MPNVAWMGILGLALTACVESPRLTDGASDTSDTSDGSDASSDGGSDTIPPGGACTDDDECELFCHQDLCADPDDDLDGDGLSNAVEVRWGSDPLKADTDGDGKPDGEEFGSATTPRDSDNDNIPDLLESALIDSDGDCLPNEIDPRNQVADGLEVLWQLRGHECSSLGVCAAGGVSATCEAGVFACDYSKVTDWVAGGVCGSDKDHDCDGQPDNTGDGCTDSDEDGIFDRDDNCPDDYNPGQEDLDGDGIGDFCDVPEDAFDIKAPPSGLISPNVPFVVTGKAQPGHTVYLYSNLGCGDVPLGLVVAREDGTFELTATIQNEGRTPLGLTVSNADITNRCQTIGEDLLVTPHRYTGLALNAARLASWDGQQGVAQVSLVPFAFNDSQDFPPERTYTLYAGLKADCADASAAETTQQDTRIYAEIPLSKASPEIYGYLQDNTGVRSECVSLGLGYGQVSLSTTVEAPYARPLAGGKAWVLGPEGTLGTYTLDSLPEDGIELPLGAGLVVESVRGRNTLSSPPLGDEPTLYTFWDLMPQSTLKVEEALSYQFSFLRYSSTTTSEPYWVWGPCGLGSAWDTYNLTIFSSVNLACLGTNPAPFTLYPFYSPSGGMGAVGPNGVARRDANAMTLNETEGTIQGAQLPWVVDNGGMLSEVGQVIYQSRLQVVFSGWGSSNPDSASVQALLWPQGAWFSGAVFAPLDTLGQATFRMMRQPVEMGETMVGLRRSSGQATRLVAKKLGDMPAMAATPLPASPTNLDVEGLTASTGQAIPRDLALGTHTWEGAKTYGADFPVRGHLKVTGTPSGTTSTHHFEHLWSLDFEGWPTWPLPTSTLVPLDNEWQVSSLEVDFLGFTEFSPWSWVLGLHRLNAEAETYAPPADSGDLTLIQVVRWKALP